MAALARFKIVLPFGGEEPQPKLPSPGAVLSKALNLATRSESPGVWDVVEYEDVVYRVHRLDSEKLDIRVEVPTCTS